MEVNTPELKLWFGIPHIIARAYPGAVRVTPLALRGTGPHESIKSQRPEPWACRRFAGKDYPSRAIFVLNAAAATKPFAVCDNGLERWIDGGILLRRYHESVR